MRSEQFCRISPAFYRVFALVERMQVISLVARCEFRPEVPSPSALSAPEMSRTGRAYACAGVYYNVGGGPKKMKRKSKDIPADGRRSASMLAAAFGAAAIGAFAIGALAIGRLAIGRIVAGRVTLKSLRVEELNVTRLRVSELVVSESLELPGGGKQENRETR
jgi:hypothetical protein